MLKTFQSPTTDHVETGKTNRALRIKAKVSIRKLAKAMKISAPYLSDLERGRRNWSLVMDDNFSSSLARLSR